METEKCFGYIQLMFFDSKNNEIVNIGGAGFIKKSDVDAEWANIRAFCGDSSFIADLTDAQGDILDTKQVSSETCECLMNKPITQLIQEGRARLADELGQRTGAIKVGDREYYKP